MVQTNPLHHSQKTTLSKDGKKLGVTIVVYNSPELEMLILGFSSSVKVLSPKALVKSIADSAQKVMSLYC